jgi:hypothetical protein
MVFYSTFNNISVISWWSVLLEKKTTDLSQVTDKLYHTMLYQTEILLKVALNTINPNNLVETKSRYHTTFYDKLFFLGVHPKT